MKYWYNISTQQVERDDETSRKENLMGPYASEEEARGALGSAAARTEAWDEEDRRRAEEDGKDPDDRTW